MPGLIKDMKLEYWHLDVFTRAPLTGNPLAVFPYAEPLCGGLMQSIANELNLSETVFVLPPDDGHHAARLRIFTPRRELEFAGHPTIGAAHLLKHLGLVTDAAFHLEENVGPVFIRTDEAQGAAICWLTTPIVMFAEKLEPRFCAELLGVSVEDLGDAPPQFVSAGSPLLFVQLRTTEATDRASLRQDLLPRALGSLNSVGTFVFAKKKPGSADVYSRMFAPQTGIPEDPATGGATGPLAAYMLKYGLLQREDVTFTSEQGVKMGRPSLLRVRVTSDRDGGEPTIEVGGEAVVLTNATMNLSEV